MNHALALWEYAAWGAFGGVAVEAIEMLGAVKRTNGLPWNQPGEVTLGALMFSVLLRLALGAGLAVALSEANQISGGVGAIATGVAAPLILEQMGKQLTSKEVKSQRREVAEEVIAVHTEKREVGPYVRRGVAALDAVAVHVEESLVQSENRQTSGDGIKPGDDGDTPTAVLPPPGPVPRSLSRRVPRSPSQRVPRSASERAASGSEPASRRVSPAAPHPAASGSESLDLAGAVTSRTTSSTTKTTTWVPSDILTPRRFRFIRKVGLGLARSTPAFGGTAEL